MASTKQKNVKNWGFDVRELSSNIRPQDDLYHYVNKKWMDAHPIPKNESKWGTFMMLRYDTDKKLHSLLQKLMSKKSKKGSDEQLLGDFFRAGMDMKTRNAKDLNPLSLVLKRIEALKSKEELTQLFAYLERAGVGTLWGSAIDQDSKNSSKYALHLYQGGLGMPDRDYYLKEDAESVRVRTAYRAHIKNVFKLMGCASKDAQMGVETLMRMETELARMSMSKEDRRDPEKTYHKLKIKEISNLSPDISWKLYFKQIGALDISTAIVMQPEFFKGMDALLERTSIEDLKTYLSWHVVNDMSGALGERFVRESFAFYGKVLSGTKQMKPLWRRVLGTVNGGLGELIGKEYVKLYFTKEAKKKMDTLVDDLFLAYEARIKSLSWMSAPTKRKALAKLRALNRKIGYPKKWKSYKGLEIRADDYAGNILRMSEFVHDREMKKLKKSIDRDEWFMYPQTVNAYFAPNMNDIVFPAAILQPPFFSLNSDDAVNYGAIGAVIGHEITHGFDDEGSKFDAKGNLKSWWSAQDRKKFEMKAKKVERQYDRYTVADGLKVNGKLTLGENIADFGGLSIAYDAYQLQLARTGRRDIDGFTPEQRFFIGFAIFERENSRPEAVKTQVLTDPHSPGIFRINGPVSNFEPFYEAFGVTKKDALYRAPANREMVW